MKLKDIFTLIACKVLIIETPYGSDTYYKSPSSPFFDNKQVVIEHGEDTISGIWAIKKETLKVHTLG